MRFQGVASCYQLLSVIGVGAAGTVFKGQYTDPVTKQTSLCALKAINLDRTTVRLETLQTECKLLAQSNHENIVGYYCSFVHQQYLWLVTPILEVNIQDLLLKLAPNGFDEGVISCIMYDILQALSYMEQNRQVHRDIKTANILLNSSGTAKLADFGVSAFLCDDSVERKMRNTLVGSPLYMAPEVISMQGHDCKADIWSFGVCLIELAQGVPPNSNLPPMEVIVNIYQKDPPKLPANKTFTKQFREVVDMCMVKNPRERASATKLLETKFFSKHGKKTTIDNMLIEYKKLMGAPVNGNNDERVSIGNQILRMPVVISATIPANSNLESWDFNDTKTEAQINEAKALASVPSDQKAPISKTATAIDVEGDVSDVGTVAMTALTELIKGYRTLQAENAKLKETNEKLIRRIRMFSDQKRESEGNN
ncbi:Kinase, STE STE20 [Giardia duodenalis]|uniref:Kinase, STE STE20 n=1 Tax=Giardia intestinalis (strain ATCC 50803 / WB clone C6) TaxID=184922 RepID=A8BP53_GIAIC|nr:Kinase, STE STE20 [Giardia intestinalis]KAE8304633.1 Kinase, STE STE20 [Giardia intestinalis]|eukprot:XP_001705862.1 Kinase, STE STE20 [Giardia lamblia ATCC 50803]